jgi:hypothetical protein
MSVSTLSNPYLPWHDFLYPHLLKYTLDRDRDNIASGKILLYPLLFYRLFPEAKV